MRYYVPLFALAVVVQIFLAGEGIFGMKEGPALDDQKTLDAHRGLGFILTTPAALLLLIFALLAWYGDRRMRWISIVLPFLIFAQQLLANAGRWGGAFHPLNAFLVLALLGWLAHRLRRPEATAPEASASAPV
jgi:Family of unknown function (DUF6220)